MGTHLSEIVQPCKKVFKSKPSFILIFEESLPSRLAFGSRGLRFQVFSKAFLPGLTLLELLVVLWLLSMVLTLVAPKLRTFIPTRPEDFVSRMERLLKETRLKALTEGRSFLLMIDPQKRMIYLTDKELNILPDTQFKIPEQVEIKGEGLLRIDDRRAIMFLSDGFCSGGEIEIISPGNRVIFRIARFQAYVVRIKE